MKPGSRLKAMIFRFLLKKEIWILEKSILKNTNNNSLLTEFLRLQGRLQRKNVKPLHVLKCQENKRRKSRRFFGVVMLLGEKETWDTAEFQRKAGTL